MEKIKFLVEYEFIPTNKDDLVCCNLPRLEKTTNLRLTTRGFLLNACSMFHFFRYSMIWVPLFQHLLLHNYHIARVEGVTRTILIDRVSQLAIPNHHVCADDSSKSRLIDTTVKCLSIVCQSDRINGFRR